MSIKPFFITLICALAILPCKAQQLRVAAAANLQGVIKVLQADFKKRTAIEAELIVGSSGKLVAQMSNGAPYDVFLSADMQFPETLYQNGFSTAGPEIYALGKLIICSKNKQEFNNWEKLLLSPEVKKIAIANPAVAPYGKAAEEALSKAGILEKIKHKLVYGESISQVNTYITTGVVDVAFTAQAFTNELPVGETLYWKAISPKNYAPIKQGMVLLKRAADNAAAKRFYDYILSGPAKRIFKKYGYTTL